MKNRPVKEDPRDMVELKKWTQFGNEQPEWRSRVNYPHNPTNSNFKGIYLNKFM